MKRLFQGGVSWKFWYFRAGEVVLNRQCAWRGCESSGLCIPFVLQTQVPVTMSYFLPHLPSGWHVDEAIKSEEDRVVVIRFGHDWDPQCMTMDETLYSVSDLVQNFAVIYLCDITLVPDFNKVRTSYNNTIIIVSAILMVTIQQDVRII